jgi:xylan 1,4-beta-xylosidase
VTNTLGKRFFEGNRALVTNENVELPVLNALRMLARLGDTRLSVTTTHGREPRADDATVEPPAREVDALATLAGQRVSVLLWHQADAWWAEGAAEVALHLERLPFSGPAVVRHFRIDGAHSNAYAEWVRLGRPDDPSPAQLDRLRLRQGLELLAPPGPVDVDPSGGLRLPVTLPIQATSLIEIEPARPA